MGELGLTSDPLLNMFVRAAALLGYNELAKHLGLNPAQCLQRAGLPAHCTPESDTLIAYPAFIQLLELSAQKARCDDFGLRSAARQGLALLGPLALLLRSTSTLAQAVTLATQYLFVHSPALKLRLKPHADQIEIIFQIQGVNLSARPQVASLSLGILCLALRELSAASVRPSQISLPCPEPQGSARYRAFYGCPVLFNSPAASLHLPASALNQPLAGDDLQLRQLAVHYLEQLSKTYPSDLPSQLQALLHNLLGTSSCGLIDIAKLLDLQPRTLQRRLKQAGTSFEQLIDKLRKERFSELIHLHDGPSLTQIAHLLGYSESSVLNRSCRRWFGCTPQTLKKPPVSH